MSEATEFVPIEGGSQKPTARDTVRVIRKVREWVDGDVEVEISINVADFDEEKHRKIEGVVDTGTKKKRGPGRPRTAKPA